MSVWQVRHVEDASKSTLHPEESALLDADSLPSHESDDHHLREESQGTTDYDPDRHLQGTIESIPDLWTIGEDLAHQHAKLGKASKTAMSLQSTRMPLPAARHRLSTPAELPCIQLPTKGQGVPRSHLATPMEMTESHTVHQTSILDHHRSVILDMETIEESLMTASQCLLLVSHAATMMLPLRLELLLQGPALSAGQACQ